MPYTGNPSAVPTDALRLYLGDTSTTNPMLSDEEVDYFLTQGNQVPVQGAYLACQALIARFAYKMTVTVGPTSVNYGQLVDQLKALSATLEAQGGKPGWLDMGLPVDASSLKSSELGGQSWHNPRAW